MRDLPQQYHADLGLVPDTDQTEDLRPDKRMAPAATGAIQKNHHVVTKTTESEF